MLYQNILAVIGHTPIVRINKLNPNMNLEMYAKLEGQNPGGSIKDRVALKMIEKAIENGELTKDRTIIEPTSGNTGIGLAMIGTVLGYSVEIVMSQAVSIERRKMIEAFGAKIILTDADKGTDGAIMKTRELVKENPDKYFMPDQFSNEYNKIAHYETTAKEIWDDMEHNVDYFISSIGTSGTIMGVGKYLKEYNPEIKIVCAYPEKGHYIQGLKNMDEALVPAIYDKSKIDEFVNVGSEDAFAMARRIAKEDGIFVGMSSGAAMVAMTELARRDISGRAIAIFPDRGEKYLSTALF